MDFVSRKTAALVCLSAVLGYGLFMHWSWKRHEQENKASTLDKSKWNTVLPSKNTRNLQKIVSLRPEAEEGGLHNDTDLNAAEGTSQRIPRFYDASDKLLPSFFRLVNDVGSWIVSTALGLPLLYKFCTILRRLRVMYKFYTILRWLGIILKVLVYLVIAVVLVNVVALFGGHKDLVMAIGRELFNTAVGIWRCFHGLVSLFSVENPGMKSSSAQRVQNPFSVHENTKAGHPTTQSWRAPGGSADEDAKASRTNTPAQKAPSGRPPQEKSKDYSGNFVLVIVTATCILYSCASISTVAGPVRAPNNPAAMRGRAMGTRYRARG